VVESRLPLRAPKWEEDHDFALEHHMHHLALPAPGDRTALQELVGDLMTMPLHRDRPLWHAYMVDGFGDGAALISRVHHCIGDGVSLGRVLLSLTDPAPDEGIASADLELDGVRPGEPPPGIAARAARMLSAGGHTGASAMRQGAEVIASPAHAARLAGAIARDGATAARLLLTPADPASAIKGDPGISRRVAWSQPVSLRSIKKIAHGHGATVNDVLLAAVSGALRHYLQERHSPVHEIQAVVPFNLRPLDRPVPRELGNRFGLVLLPLPVGVSGAYRRLIEIHRRMDEIKHSRDAPVSYALLSATGLAPAPLERRIVDLFSGKGTAVMTNVQGPARTVYLAGTPVRTVLFWAPTSGHIGMSVSIHSYRGEVTVGLMVDAALVPDPDKVIVQFNNELHALGRLKRVDSRRPQGVAGAAGAGGERPSGRRARGILSR
jgi:WS/DGAT/MGAT family acyltransferase